MSKVFLLNPLAVINKRHVHFLRDWCGGELPASIIYPPLDLAYAASFLNSRGIKVDLLDASALHVPPKKVVEIIARQKPEFIGIPSAWGSIRADLLLSRMIKEVLPETKIIFSGPNVTIDPDIALSSGYVDYVVLGELEKAFLDIIRGSATANVAYRENGKTIITNRALLENLDSLPFPARELLPNSRYQAPFIRRNPFTTMLTSRGCPYQCNFCQVNIWYLEKVRFRSVDNVIGEIEEIIKKFKINEIIFRDQTLTVDRERLISLCRSIIKRNYDISWRCFSCVDTVNEELLRIMKEAGCHQICYGLESGSQRVLDLSGKEVTLEQAKRAVKLTKEAGIEVSGAFMFGMHGDTEETIKETLDFALSLDLDFAQFQLAVPVPSTKFYEQCISKDHSFDISSYDHRWYGWDRSKNRCDSHRIALKAVKEAYRKFYFRKDYIYRQLKKLRNPKQFFFQMKAAAAVASGLNKKVN